MKPNKILCLRCAYFDETDWKCNKTGAHMPVAEECKDFYDVKYDHWNLEREKTDGLRS